MLVALAMAMRGCSGDAPVLFLPENLSRTNEQHGRSDELRCQSFVMVMQAAELPKWAIALPGSVDVPCADSVRPLLEIGASAKVSGNDASQMTLVQNDTMVEAVAS